MRFRRCHSTTVLGLLSLLHKTVDGERANKLPEFSVRTACRCVVASITRRDNPGIISHLFFQRADLVPKRS